MATTLTARPIDKPIRNKAALTEAIAELDSFIDDDPDEGTPDFDRMELLAILISDYEARTLPPLKVTPQEMVRHTAEQMGVSPGELAELMGGRSRLSNFYNGIRPLSTGQMINLRDRLKIPADLLLRSKEDSVVIEVIPTMTVANREKFRRAYEGGLEANPKPLSSTPARRK